MAKDMNKFIQKNKTDATNYVERYGRTKTYVCPQCNETFERKGTHVDYRIGNLHFCTYTHKKEYERAKDNTYN